MTDIHPEIMEAARELIFIANQIAGEDDRLPIQPIPIALALGALTAAVKERQQ